MHAYAYACTSTSVVHVGAYVPGCTGTGKTFYRLEPATCPVVLSLDLTQRAAFYSQAAVTGDEILGVQPRCYR